MNPTTLKNPSVEIRDGTVHIRIPFSADFDSAHLKDPTDREALYKRFSNHFNDNLTKIMDKLWMGRYT